MKNRLFSGGGTEFPFFTATIDKELKDVIPFVRDKKSICEKSIVTDRKQRA